MNLQDNVFRAAENVEIGVGVFFSQKRLVFAQCHFKLPAQVVLDSPMAVVCLGKAAALQIMTENIIANFCLILSKPLGDGGDRADRFEILLASQSGRSADTWRWKLWCKMS